MSVPTQKSERSCMCVASFYDFDIEIWNCSDSVVFFGTVPTVWYFLDLFRQCGIFWNCSDSEVFFGTFRQCGIFWNCSDSVVFF